MSRYDSKLKEGAQPFLADGEELLAAVIANPRGYTQSVAVAPNVDNLEGAEIGLECTRVIEAPGPTHLSYRVVK